MMLIIRQVSLHIYAPRKIVLYQNIYIIGLHYLAKTCIRFDQNSLSSILIKS